LGVFLSQHAILSPSESLGLAGASLDSRVKNAARHISDTTFARLAQRLKQDAFDSEIVYEREGVRDAVRIMLRPLLALHDQLTYVHHVCLQLTEALKRLPGLYLNDPEIRAIMRVSEAEERWLREMWTPAHARNNPIYGRLDAVCDFASQGWQDTLKFMEPNLSGVGGIHFSPIAEQLVMRDLVPSLAAHDPGLKIGLPQDQRDLFVQVLIDHARAVGRPDCQLCFIEPKYEHDGPDEQSALSKYLAERRGLVITHADPRELSLKDGEVFYGDTRVDVAYRDYETRDILELEKEAGKPLEAMRTLFRENRIVSSIVGDFDHKSGFELLTDPVIAEKYFSPDDMRLFERHVLWTRVVSARKTTLPNRTSGDLLEFIRKNRETLVLKPNRAYGGEGVALGAGMTQSDWETLLSDATSKGADPNLSWVVQAATRLPVVEFPVVGNDGRVYGEPFYAVMGFAPTDNGIGCLCRVSQKQVVNVAQHGGMAALLTAEPPKDLRAPRRSQARDESARAALRAEIAEIRHLDAAISLMNWDEETYLPPRGRDERGEQAGTLEAIRHARLVSDRLADLIEEVAGEGERDASLTREIFLLRRERKAALAVPEELVRALAEARSHAFAAWEEARAKNAFAPFVQPLGEVLKLVRERAQSLGPGPEPYDALLDEYEPGMTRSRLDPLLSELRDRLVPLVSKAAVKTARNAAILSGRRFETQGQWELSHRALEAIGFDFARGRLDPTTHPFTMQAGTHDVRVTSRVDEGDLSNGLLATMHEGGHALYDQGFSEADAGTLLAEGASSGLHEGMARLWENHVGRSRGFADFLLPHLRELFPAASADLDPEKFFRGINVVQPGTSRTRADEMTYHLHIVLRYELETELLSGALRLDDLRGAWNEKSRALLGIVPETDREGVLQDVHWASGMFGYFPTYTIGSLYAAQLVETYGKTNDLESEIRNGNFSGLRNWLTKNVYEKGHRLAAEDIVTRATGKGLDTAAFFRHLESAERAWNQP
jgi:carboxypeptidase Taq